MPEYDPSAEVYGGFINAFVESAGGVSPIFEQKTRDMIEDHIGELEEDGWYNLGDLMNAYSEIHEEVGPKTMRQGGYEVPSRLEFPEETDLEDALEMLSQAQVSEDAFRNSEMDAPAGRFVYTLNSDRSARLAVTKGYNLPKPYTAGLYEGVIDRWGPDDVSPEFEEVPTRRDERFAWEVEW